MANKVEWEQLNATANVNCPTIATAVCSTATTLLLEGHALYAARSGCEESGKRVLRLCRRRRSEKKRQETGSGGENRYAVLLELEARGSRAAASGVGHRLRREF